MNILEYVLTCHCIFIFFMPQSCSGASMLGSHQARQEGRKSCGCILSLRSWFFGFWEQCRAIKNLSGHGLPRRRGPFHEMNFSFTKRIPWLVSVFQGTCLSFDAGSKKEQIPTIFRPRPILSEALGLAWASRSTRFSNQIGGVGPAGWRRGAGEGQG